MRFLSFIFKHLFQFKTYKKGLVLHLSLLFLYSLLFIAVYYIKQSVIEPVDEKAYHQRQLSQTLVIVMILHLLSLILLRWPQFVALSKEYFTEKGSPYNLAIFRIFFFSSMAGHFLFFVPRNNVSWTHLPDSNRVGLPFIDWLVYNIPISPGLYAAMAIIAGILCWLICFGLFTRYVLPLLIPVVFYVVGVPLFYGKFSHSHLFLWAPLILCFAPVSDVWSLDSFLRRKKEAGKPLAHLKYLLPFKVLWLQLTIIYSFAGIMKLWHCGLDWALGDSMINQMRWEWIEHYDKVPAFRLDNCPVLAGLGGLSIIYFELLYFLFILKPGGRIWAFISAFSFHKICGYFMYIDFTTLRHVHLSYINWERFAEFFKKKKNTTGEVTTAPVTANLWTIFKKEKVVLPVIIAIVLLSLNFIFSAFRIHSYPFSSFATYSGIVPDKITILRMDAFTANGKKVDVKALGKKAAYRWENVRIYEKRIAESFADKDSVGLKIKLEDYWRLWCINVPAIKEVSKVNMFLETTSLVPEERTIILSRDSLGTIYPTNEPIGKSE